jgi:hypothetical protein
MFYEDFIKAAENAHLSKFSSLVFFSLVVGGAQESIPRNRYRQPI